MTRFEGGLVVEINPPDLELRIAILQRTLSDWQMEIDDGTLLMVAERGGTNVRALLGALPARPHVLRDGAQPGDPGRS